MKILTVNSNERAQIGFGDLQASVVIEGRWQIVTTGI